MSAAAPIRRLRSLLYVPASNARALEKARELPCDGVILDLEDAVAPEEKPRARDAAVAAIAGGFGDRLVAVRCNAPSTPWGADDLAAMTIAGPDAVLAPKVRGAEDVAGLDRALTGAPEHTRLWSMIETPGAVLELPRLKAASARLEALVLGLNDLALELRVKLGDARTAVQPILSQTVVAARAQGLLAFDGVFNAIDDADGFAAECAQAVAFGFDGKTLIHPAQIEPCNRAFSPSDAEVAWARKVAAAFSAPEAAGRGALRLEGRMIESLDLRDAERVLALAEG